MIYTDSNSCYSVKFSELGISDIHHIAPEKSQTHMIESINSSIRDNLARFCRRSKKYNKCINMLDDTLILFFNRKQYKITIWLPMSPVEGRYVFIEKHREVFDKLSLFKQ